MGPRLGTKRPRQRRSALPGRGELVRTNGARRDTGRRDNGSARGPSRGTGALPYAGKDWRSRDRTTQRPICPTSRGRGGACPGPAAWPGRKSAPTTNALCAPRISDPIPDAGQETRNLVISEWRSIMIRAEQPCQVASRVQMELGPFPRDDRGLGPAPCPPPQGGMVFTCGCEGRRKENETAPEHGATLLAQPAENHNSMHAYRVPAEK